MIIAFDLFGTIFDLSKTPREEIKEYLEHIKKPWSPLKLPDSWLNLEPFNDVRWLEKIREFETIVTCSNAPLGFQIELLKKVPYFDGIIPLELNKVYKPDPKAYMTICEVMNVQPKNVIMVTGNKTLGDYGYGDVDVAEQLGMTGVLIRDGRPKQRRIRSIVDLYLILREFNDYRNRL